MTKTKRLDLLKSGRRYLAERRVRNSKGEVELLLCHVLDCSRHQLYLNNLEISERDFQYFWQLLTERSRGLPLQYLVGSTEFMGLEFKVGFGVFIPRPETEILVETILNLLLKAYSLKLKILDIGTGCGNICISIAKFLKKAHIFACDICDSALQLTKENARLNKVRISLVKSDLFCAFKKNNLFSLIVSNPPYIRRQQISKLAQEIHYEPKEALDGGLDGLNYYRRIIKQAPDYLEGQGLLALEIGDEQIDSVKSIFAQHNSFSSILVFRDYHNIERVIIGKKG